MCLWVWVLWARRAGCIPSWLHMCRQLALEALPWVRAALEADPTGGFEGRGFVPAPFVCRQPALNRLAHPCSMP